MLKHAESRVFLEDLLARELTSATLKSVDRALVQELCYGVVRWQLALDWLIQKQARQPETSVQARVLLRLGLYQLFWLDRIPAHAAVNETVEAARTLELGPLGGFVNAMLRNYARNIDTTKAALQELKTKDPAVGWSHPKWWIERTAKRLSPGDLQALLAWNNQPADTFARLNRLKTDGGPLIARWRDEGVDYDFAKYDWTSENQIFRLRHHPSIERLKTFKDGWFYVQDPSTLLAVHLLAPRAGERVLDLCAAPGGKATLIADALDNDGEVIAAEPDARRRQRLTENCDRLGADVVVVAPNDPRTAGPFDAVLIDAPCSNTGVLRRRIDARWRLTPNDITQCHRIQVELLSTGLKRLGPQGRAVYSTCSLEPEENEQVVEEVLAKLPGFTVAKSQSLHPVRDKTDGAYVALIVPTSSAHR
ncbi:MAG: 16S rRNA (cytosine(967)-C(5))-methyltransferase RsmB [Verrucomicrobiales bacterium]|nr:16S rRNA (cytosine(967)-C(5))-methyltransferase RsmB [Verrucomicrobiales bacterium]